MYFAFAVTTLVDHGWSYSATAATMTAISVITMLTQPLFGFISDKAQSEKKLTIALMILAAIFILLMPFSFDSGSMVLIFLNMAGLSVAVAQVGGLIDAWIVGLKQEYPSVNYGIIRGTGSLSFAIASQVAGMLTVAFGHNVRLWVGFGFLLLTIFAAISFRAARRTGQEVTEESQVQKLTGPEAIRLVFSSKRYTLLLVVSFFLMLSNTTMSMIVQLMIRDFSGTAAHIGTASAVMAGSEVPLMFLMATLLKRFGFKKLILVCGTFYVIRMLITSSVSSVDGIIYVQLLQGLTYAILMPLSMSYLSQILDERIRSTAVTTYAAVTVGLTGILGNLITTTLLAAGFSAQAALIVFSASALIGLSLAVYGVIRKIW